MSTPPSTATSPRSGAGGAGGPQLPRAGGPRFPRWLLILVTPLLAILMVGFFVFLQFPFDRFSSGLAAQAGATLGADVVIGSLDPAMTVGGPGFVASQIQIRWPDGARAEVETVRIRPAWSPSWLSGNPALQIDASSDIGGVHGTLTVGNEPAFAGRLEAVALDRLPVDRFASGAVLDGTLDLDADLVLAERGPLGTASFSAVDGSMAAAQLPIAMPYDVLRGNLDFAEDGSLKLEGVALEGPMISATVEGGTGPGPSLLLAPLDLEIELQVSDRNLRPTFSAAGLRLSPDGTANVRVKGNLAAPIVR